MVKFNKKFVDNNPYPISLKEYFINLCNQVGLIAGSEVLINGDYQILGNPFTNNEDCKTVLSAIAQLCGGFAKIGRDNKVYIINLSKEVELENIDANNYDTTFQKNNIWGEVNSLVIKVDNNVQGEETKRQDATSIQTNGLTEVVIAGNPFLINEIERNNVIEELWDAIKGLKYTPFSTNYYGYPYLDAGDKIKILDSADNEYETFIFNHTFTYNGAFNGRLETKALTKTQSQYQNTNNIKNKFRNVEFKVDKINGEIESVIEEVTDQNQKIAIVEQTVGELNSKISDIADITTSKESTNARIDFEGINQSEPIYIHIHPIGENISYLYPHNNLFLSDTLFLKNRKLRFTNTTTNEVWDYELPANLLIYDSENYDEFILDYDSQSVMVNKRCGYNADGTVKLLDTMKTYSYDFPKIELTDGDYKIELLGYNNAYMLVRLMAQNIYTTQFATKAEMKSEIKQTAEEIDLNVNKKLSNYSTTTQMNSAINVKANEITSTVSETYETKANATINYSKLTQTATSLQSQISANDKEISTLTQTATSLQTQIIANDTDISTIKQTVSQVNIEVGKKYNTSDFTNAKIVAKINDGTSSVLIKANRIDLSGYLTISSASSTYASKTGLSAGTTTINGNCITTGTIDASKVSVKNLNASNITSGTISASKISGGTITASAINLGSGKFAVTTAGAITATSGKIGGFTLGSTKIYHSKSTLTTSTAGVYIGTDGISLGANSTFKVTSAGALTATNATISGTITATSGTFENCTIKNTCSVPASTINGILGTGNIPNLSASKITSGKISATLLEGVNATFGTLGASADINAGGYVNAYYGYTCQGREGIEAYVPVPISITVEDGRIVGQTWRRLVFKGGILTAVQSSW